MADQITNNLNIVADADSLASWADADHGTMTRDLELVIFVEGSGSIGDRISGDGAVGGIGWDYGVNTDLTAQVVYMWAAFTTATLLELKVNGGVAMRFTGATSTDFFEVNLDGVDTYGGGFKMNVVDVDLAAASPDTIGGSPPATTDIHWVGMVWRTTGAVLGSANTGFVDVFSTLAAGTPGIIVEGDNTGVPWNWQDIVDAGDVADTTKAWGTITQKDGVIFLNTPVQFGISDASDHDFADVGKVISWEDRIVKDGFYGLSALGNAGGTTNVTAGTKVGSGETAVGVSGWTILTGGPRWFVDMEDANQDGINFYGCSFTGSGIWSVNSSAVEIISCVYANCDQMTISGGGTGPTVLSTFFSEAPGPLAQIKWGNATTATDGQFDFNSFVNMLWWAIEFDTAGSYDLRGVAFSGNGTARDVLASHNSGEVEINVLEVGDTPGVTNGATVTITTAGASDIRMTAVSLDNVNETTPVSESNGANTIAGGDPLTAGVTPDDTNTYLAAVYGADVFGTVDWSGSSAYVEQVEEEDVLGNAVTGGAALEGPAAALQTASADHSGTVLNAALSVIEVDNEAASPVLVVDPEWRPVEKTLASTTHVFGYGVPGEGTSLAAFVFVHTQDVTAADTVVSSVSWGGTNMTEERVDFADDSGGGGEGVSTTAFRLRDTVLRKGTVVVNASVPIEINGVTEGARVIIERTDTDVELLNALAFTSDGQGTFKAAGSFSFASDTPVRVSAASSGKPVSAASDDNNVFTDETVNANSASTDDMTLLPAVPVATEDGYVFGHTEQFGQIDLVLTTAGTGGFTITWEYWNGSIWTALSGVSDGTSSFSSLGTGRVSWTIPGGWTARTIPSQLGTTVLFYIRASYSAGSVTIVPVGRQVTMDVTKYLRWEDSNTVTSAGLATKATWVIDTIAKF